MTIEPAIKIIMMLLATGVVSAFVNGSALMLLPCVLAAYAVWHVAQALRDS